MANRQDYTVPGGQQQQGGPTINVTFQNAPTAAAKLAQGGAVMLSTECRNSNQAVVNEEVDEQEELAPEASSSKKTDEADSGCGQAESLGSPIEQRAMKRINPRAGDGDMPAAKQLCGMDAMSVARAFLHLLQQPNNAQPPMQPSMSFRNDDQLDASIQQNSSQVQYPQHGSTNGAIPGTSCHPTPTQLSSVQWNSWHETKPEESSRYISRDSLVSTVNGNNNNNTSGYSRTAEFVEKHGGENFKPVASDVDDLGVPFSHLETSTGQRGCQPVQRTCAAYSNMALKRQRERSFTHRLATNYLPAPSDLAKAGFFYLETDATVRCWFCGGALENWEHGSVPWEEHAKWFPNCEFLLESKNQKFVIDHHKLWEPPKRDGICQTRGCIPVEQTCPVHRNKCLATTRTKSFRPPWITRATLPASLLAMAGFFYTGEGDKVECWHCGCQLEGWCAGDVPLKEHAKWFPNCESLLEKLGPEHVKHDHWLWQIPEFASVKSQEELSEEVQMSEKIKVWIERAKCMGISDEIIEASSGNAFCYSLEKYLEDLFMMSEKRMLKEEEDISRAVEHFAHAEEARSWGITNNEIRLVFGTRLRSGLTQPPSKEELFNQVFAVRAEGQSEKETSVGDEKICQIPCLVTARYMGISDKLIEGLLNSRLSTGQLRYKVVGDFIQDLVKTAEKMVGR